METISFESEYHNIYDPYFTSEDELLSASSENNSLPSYLRPTPRRLRATRQPIPLENSLDSEFSVSSMNTSALSSEDELMIIHGLTPIPGDPSGFQSGRRRIEDFIVRQEDTQRVI